MVDNRVKARRGFINVKILKNEFLNMISFLKINICDTE